MARFSPRNAERSRNACQRAGEGFDASPAASIAATFAETAPSPSLMGEGWDGGEDECEEQADINLLPE